MKLLLTSGGISNPSIYDSLVDLLGKPVEETSALFIPTAIYGLSFGASQAYKDIIGTSGCRFTGLGWKSMGVLELSALPTLQQSRWLPTVREADALLVGGGDPLYLCYWLRRSGLADLLPSLLSKVVYVGLSAGSMVAGSDFGGENYGGLNLDTDDDSGLNLVDVSVFPHLDYPGFREEHARTCRKMGGRKVMPDVRN